MTSRPAWLADVVWARTVALDDRAFRWGRLGTDYVGQWKDVLLVRVDAAGLVKARIASAGASADIVEKVWKGEATAFARAIVGRFSIHAAAVAFGREAIVLLGPSGAGKSTIASHLCDSGAALLADDVAGLETGSATPRVAPGERAVWLAGAHGRKSPVSRRCAAEPIEIVALACLDFSGEASGPPIVHTMRPSSVVAALLEALLRFDPVPALWAREFDVVSDLAARVRAWRVVRTQATPPELVAERLRGLAQRTQSMVAQESSASGMRFR